jgi:DNA-binding NtrC family response regulator
MTKYILVVDDEESGAFFLGENLAELGPAYTVDVAHSGEDALRKFDETTWDLVITDFRLTGISGLDLIEALQASHPETRAILITAYGNTAIAERAERLGVFRYLTKPFAVDQLLSAVQAALAPPAQELPSVPAPSVLVMEDDASLLNLYAKALRARGYAVQPVDTLDVARELLHRETFDVFICDLHVGGNCAMQLLCDQIATLQARGTQVIVVSADALYRESCEDLDIEFYYQKPVSIPELMTLVERLVNVPAVV